MKAFLTMAVLVFALEARAEDVKPVRVGASHRVDVIAPGERVETAIDRMRRAGGTARDIAPRPPDRLAPRSPVEHGAAERTAERPDHGTPSDAQRQPPATPPGSPATTGNPGPPRR
jgi:hypothetical protein